MVKKIDNSNQRFEQSSPKSVGGVVTKGQCLHYNIEISARRVEGTSAMSTHLKSANQS
jgi:hypothetical protein